MALLGSPWPRQVKDSMSRIKGSLSGVLFIHLNKHQIFDMNKKDKWGRQRKGRIHRKETHHAVKTPLIPVCFNIKLNNECSKPGSTLHPVWTQIFCPPGKTGICFLELPILQQLLWLCRRSSTWAANPASLHFLSTFPTLALYPHLKARLHHTDCSSTN